MAENDIDPVVGGLKGAGRKGTAAAVVVNTIALVPFVMPVAVDYLPRIEIVPVNSKISRR